MTQTDWNTPCSMGWPSKIVIPETLYRHCTPVLTLCASVNIACLRSLDHCTPKLAICQDVVRTKWLRWQCQAMKAHVTQPLSLAPPRPLTVNRLLDWLVEWLIDWLNDWLVGWLTDWLNDWLFDCLINGLIDWLIIWLIDCLLAAEPTVQLQARCLCRPAHSSAKLGHNAEA